MTHEPSNHRFRPRVRAISTALALLAAGTFIGVTSQQLVSADISAGDRPVLIPIEPCRLSDTRPGDNQVGPRSAPLGAGDVQTIDAQEAGTPCTGKVPSDATALSLNVTALNATELSFITIWAGGDRPLAASLNPAPGQPPVPNVVTTQLSIDQEFEVYNNAGAVNVVIDLNGYYANHNHNDAYSPLGHDHAHDHDAQYEPLVALREISIDVGAAEREGGGFSPGSGVSLANGVSVYPTFSVPRNITPGSVMTIDVTWRSFVASCLIGFVSGGSTAAWRPDVFPVPFTMTFPASVPSPSTGIPQLTTGTITGAVAGDAIILDIEPTGTCGAVDITGLAITYT